MQCFHLDGVPSARGEDRRYLGRGLVVLEPPLTPVRITYARTQAGTRITCSATVRSALTCVFLVERQLTVGGTTCNMSLSPYPCSSLRLYFRDHHHTGGPALARLALTGWAVRPCTPVLYIAAISPRRAPHASRKEGLYTRTGILLKCLRHVHRSQTSGSAASLKRHKHQIVSTSSVPLHCSRRAFQPTRQPHIAVFMADDLGYLTSYAGSQSCAPHLDLLSLHGTILSQFRAPTWYLCHTSHPQGLALLVLLAHFLTGDLLISAAFAGVRLLARVHDRAAWLEVGMASAFGWTTLGRDSMLLPAMLKELGYRTAVVGKLTSIRRRAGISVGRTFRLQHRPQYGFLGGMSDYYQHHHTWSRDGVKLREEGYMTELLAAEAERVSPDARVAPMRTPRSFCGCRSAPPRTPQAPNEWIQGSAPISTRCANLRCDGGAMDDALVELLVRSVPLAVTLSLIIFASDGGQSFRRLVTADSRRQGSPYDGGFRAPAFVFWPGASAAAPHPVSRPMIACSQR